MTEPLAPVAADLAAEWIIHLPDGIHKVQFEHGTTSGKRVIWVDDQEVLRKNWMFSLVGSENFRVNAKPATITIESRTFSFIYTMTINGKSLKQFVKAQNKNTRTWLLTIRGERHRVVIDVKTMDIYVDGNTVETVGEFVDGGAENHFCIGSTPVHIKTFSSGHSRKGLLYKLVIGDEELDPVLEATGE